MKSVLGFTFLACVLVFGSEAASQDKPGYCAPVQNGIFNGARCTFDNTCSGTMKCCDGRCAAASFAPKAGSCMNAGSGGAACTYDYNCGSIQKCCNRRCATPAKAGSCARPGPGMGIMSGSKCSNDFDCNGNQKCCNGRCANPAFTG